MGDPKGIIDVGIEASNEFCSERGIIRFFAGIEAQVLHDLDTGSQLCNSLRNDIEREPGIHLSLGSIHVRATHHGGTLVQEPLQGRERGSNSKVV